MSSWRRVRLIDSRGSGGGGGRRIEEKEAEALRLEGCLVGGGG